MAARWITTFNVSVSGDQVQVFGKHTYTKGGQFYPVVTLTYQNSYSITATATLNAGSNDASCVTFKKKRPVHIVTSPALTTACISEHLPG